MQVPVEMRFFAVAPRAVTILPSFYSNCELQCYIRTSTNLIKCWENVVCELNLGDGGGSGHGESDAEPSDALFAQRSVEHAVLAVFFLWMNNQLILQRFFYNMCRSSVVKAF